MFANLLKTSKFSALHFLLGIKYRRLYNGQVSLQLTSLPDVHRPKSDQNFVVSAHSARVFEARLHHPWSFKSREQRPEPVPRCLSLRSQPSEAWKLQRNRLHQRISSQSRFRIFSMKISRCLRWPCEFGYFDWMGSSYLGKNINLGKAL